MTKEDLQQELEQVSLEHEIFTESRRRIQEIPASEVGEMTPDEWQAKQDEITAQVRTEIEERERQALEPEPPMIPNVAPFRVSNTAIGDSHYNSYFEVYSPAGEENEVTFTFISVKTKQEIGVVCKSDGTIAVGSWTAEGEWLELKLIEDDGDPGFDTSEYGRGLDSSIVPQ